MAQNINDFTIRLILERDKLNGSNYLDWSRNLRIVLKQEKRLYVLDAPLPPEPAGDASAVEWETYETYKGDSNEVTYLMLATMIPDLQKQFVNQEAYEIMVNLKNMFQVQARNERFVATKALTSCRMTPGTSASAHVLKMKGYLDTLERLEVQVPKELAIDLILASLSDAFDEFVKNYKLQEMTESVMELYGMLRTAEESIQKSNPLLKVKKGKDREERETE